MAKYITRSQTATSPNTSTEVVSGVQEVSVSSTWKRKYVVILLASVSALYIAIAVVQEIFHVTLFALLYAYLADGWLHGHLYLHTLPAFTDDLTPYNGHWYLAYPPLPAVFMLPLIAVFHLKYVGISSLLVSVIMGIVNIGLTFRVLKRFADTSARGMTFTSIVWLLVLFTVGSEQLYAAMQASVWYLASVIATTFLLLYTGETLSKRRPLVAGLFLGLSSLARPTVIFTFLFFVLLTFATERRKPLAMLKRVGLFGATLGVFVAGMLFYNKIRFNSWLDFGYNTMLVSPQWRANLHTYGQFSPHFLPVNLYYMLISTPALTSKFPFLTFSLGGTGLFWTMPALLFAFFAFRNRENRWMALALLSSCLLTMAVLALYFTTGADQFGYRYSLDFLPLALLLAALGMRAIPTWREKLLISLSVLLNVGGYFIITYFRP